MSILHVTGCDGTGKSTICNALVDDLQGNYTHFSNPKDMADGKKQYFDFLAQNTDVSKLHICDRFHDGEWVYAPMYRGYIADYLPEIEKKIIEDHNYMLAYITADAQTIINRTRVRGEDFVKDESHYQIILDNFMNNYLMDQKMPFTIVDTTLRPTQDNIQMVKDDWDKAQQIWNKYKNCAANCNIIKPLALPRGNIRAKYMIVGQNPAGKGKSNEDYVTMWSGNSDFFIDVLKQAGIYLDCWFTNVVSCSTPNNKITENQAGLCKDNIGLQLKLIKPKKIFTLGKEATKYFEYYYPQEDIIEVPHPSYIKRFFSGKEKEMEKYVNLFRSNSF